ncbi:RNA pseudouridine synthase [uncultured Endozoicomonas sp.]|uniref:pseudouridine synthase n=1 Tax=uncultured Endozoicomonas sp. TaxID=432652 RepID=UPI00260E8E54|nr:RNA pseudouridine synthase [uncultured Endozoicomonas sp.]
MMPTIRLSKFISDAGVCSRRQASRLIESGVVLVNGRQGKHSDRINDDDSVFIEGKRLILKKKNVNFIYHKPVGIDCVLNIEDKDSIIHYLPACDAGERVFPVGRLDKDSRGLMLLTNDGELCQKLIHPDYYHEKEYWVRVDKPLSALFIKKMAAGVSYKNVVTRPCIIERIDDYSFKIILTEGKNRQIRQMCQSLGYRVLDLYRHRLKCLVMRDLEEGGCSHLSESDVQGLLDS